MTYSDRFKEILQLAREPIAIGFLDSEPEGVERWGKGDVPAGCSFWQKAMDGQSFYTVPANHFNCAVGSYTHKIDLPEDRAHELTDTLTFMAENNYVAMSEVPGIPTLEKTPAAIAYAPIDSATFKPDVILFAVNP